MTPKKKIRPNKNLPKKIPKISQKKNTKKNPPPHKPPVGATAMTSKPAKAHGQACACIGNGKALRSPSVLKSSIANSSTKGGKEVLRVQPVATTNGWGTRWFLVGFFFSPSWGGKLVFSASDRVTCGLKGERKKIIQTNSKQANSISLELLCKKKWRLHHRSFL